MKIGDLLSEQLTSLPEDVFALISRFLSPTDVCNLTLCCKTLRDLVDSEKIWLVQCEAVKALPLPEIVRWRTGISSYKSLCRFLVEVTKPLVGVWVHQNPELGNVVYVMSGFLSVIGCRIIPQEVGSLGIREGRLMWSPVFEIVSDFDGSGRFFLHGVDRESGFLYPGFVASVDKCCNVLLLEVEPRRREVEKRRAEKEVLFPFCKLPFCDRRKLLYLVTGHVGVPVSKLSLSDDKVTSLERRDMLLKRKKFGGDWSHMEEDELCYDPIQVEINDELWTHLGYGGDFRHVDDEVQVQGTTQRKSLGKYFRNGIKNILRRSSSTGSSSSKQLASCSSEIRRFNLKTFLSSGDFLGLSVKASKIKLASYRGWPSMHETHFALYKLPIKQLVEENQDYAGLWGGTIGWPPGKCTEEKPGKALFLLMLTYEVSQDGSNERLLVGTKILEGTHYVMHPNGSAMFVVKIGSPTTSEIFPFDNDTNGEEGYDFECSYSGEGIAKGYGFRYPGYKPGSLFVTSKGLLMFVWKETKTVLTLQRLNLEELLKKGVCVSPLPPCLNFTYLTKSHTNVFASGQITS